MRTAFLILLLIHGLIHLLGFTKAYKLAQVEQLTQSISRGHGILWFIATLLFLATAILFFFRIGSWWMLALLALVLSQYLIFTTWQDARVGSIANLIILLVAVVGIGHWNFSNKFKDDVKMGLVQTSVDENELLTEADLNPLPIPVKKYIRLSGALGQAKVGNFRVKLKGKIRQDEHSEWMPFTTTQYNFMDNPTRLFWMDATMKKLPVGGYHRFADGRAYMDIRLLSLFRVQYQEGEEMDQAETVTFFNDMCMMAPATLIDKRIEWLENSGDSVKASFTHKGIKIHAWLYFDEEGRLINFRSDDRFANEADGSMASYPWLTPVKNYRKVSGFVLPAEADAIYRYPRGDIAYGSFDIQEVEYNLR